MKLTIIRTDGAVYKDGISYANLDLSTIPSNVHALQFNDIVNAGWIEFVQDDFGNKEANENITSLPAWANEAVLKWDEAKSIETSATLADQQAAEASAKNQPTTQGTQTL
jgi:hypothetical protein